VYRFTFGCFEPRAAPDNVVNVLDLYNELAAYAGRFHGPPSAYDLNNDNVLGVTDVMLVARNLNTKCPH
jgi:hypothetical protein